VGNTTGNGGVTYTLSANDGKTYRTSAAHCPGPAIGAGWGDDSQTMLNITLEPGQSSVNVPFRYWNAGESGSILEITGCTKEVCAAVEK
jgi:hypothetical protein